MPRNYRQPSIDALRDIVAQSSAARFRFPSNNKSVLVDTFTANAIVRVFDALENVETKAKIERMIESAELDKFMRVSATCFKCLK